MSVIVVSAPTLLDGLLEVTRLARAHHVADLAGVGVLEVRNERGHLVAVSPDDELPAGVVARESVL